MDAAVSKRRSHLNSQRRQSIVTSSRPFLARGHIFEFLPISAHNVVVHTLMVGNDDIVRGHASFGDGDVKERQTYYNIRFGLCVNTKLDSSR